MRPIEYQDLANCGLHVLFYAIMVVMVLQAIPHSHARCQTMTTTGPRIDPQQLYTREELGELLPASLLRIIILKATKIEGLYSGHQVGKLILKAYEEGSGGDESGQSATSSVKSMYLTIAQVARILNSSAREVTRLVDAGKLMAMDLNEGMGKKKRALRFRREWIDDLEALMAVQPEEQPQAKFRFSTNGISRKK